MAYWLFQGNPKYYRIIDGIRDFEQMLWLVTSYTKEFSPSDGVLIWKSGDKAGVYANLPKRGALLTPKSSNHPIILLTPLILATG